MIFFFVDFEVCMSFSFSFHVHVYVLEFKFEFAAECLCMYKCESHLINETESCIRIEKERETKLHFTTIIGKYTLAPELKPQVKAVECSFAIHTSNKCVFVYLFSQTDKSDRVI